MKITGAQLAMIEVVLRERGPGNDECQYIISQNPATGVFRASKIGMNGMFSFECIAAGDAGYGDVCGEIGEILSAVKPYACMDHFSRAQRVFIKRFLAGDHTQLTKFETPG